MSTCVLVTGRIACGTERPCLCPASWGFYSLSPVIRLFWGMTRRRPPDFPRTSVKGRPQHTDITTYTLISHNITTSSGRGSLMHEGAKAGLCARAKQIADEVHAVHHSVIYMWLWSCRPVRMPLLHIRMQRAYEYQRSGVIIFSFIWFFTYVHKCRGLVSQNNMTL